MILRVRAISARFHSIIFLGVISGLPYAQACGADKSDEYAVNAVFGDEFVAENVAAVRRRSRRMASAQRYDFLADWVLPSQTHATIRLNGAFTPAFPPAAGIAGDEAAGRSAIGSSLTGAGLYCPALELIELARLAGRLPQLRERVAATAALESEQQRRAKAAMLFLVDVARGNDAAMAQSAQALTQLVENSPHSAQSADFREWPELVAAWVGLRDPKAWVLIADLVTEMRLRQLLEPNSHGSSGWAEQISSLHGLLQHLQNHGGREDFFGPPPLKNWLAASIVTERSNAEGYPKAHWQWDDLELKTLSSHDQSLLFYKTPLRGDFEISCDLLSSGLGELHLVYGGEYVIPREDRRSYEVGDIGGHRRESLDPPLTKPLEATWCRVVVRDNTCTTFFNGRLVHERKLAADHDPWLAIRATSSRFHAPLRNLRIDGKPDIPDEVDLCADKSLTGWWSYFDRDGSPGRWQHLEDEGGKGLLALHPAGVAAARGGSVLHYYRPLAEGDSLRYEFYCEANGAHLHPALDGLALLLQPEGVRLHLATDEPHPPGNGVPAEASGESNTARRVFSRPHVQSDAWNRCQLTRRADAVDVTLNDQLIYRFPQEFMRQGLFGFFRFPGEGELRVRNVVWHGRPGPAFEARQQQLVQRGPHPLDARPVPFETFEHDFVSSGLPLELFEVPTGRSVEIRAAQHGVVHSQTSSGAWTDSSIVPPFRMKGDFDVTASFDDLRVTAPDYGGAALVLRNEDGRVMQLSRRMQSSNSHRVYLTWRAPVTGGKFRMIKDTSITEALTGRFRVARRGDTYFFLIAEHDSPVFRTVGQQTIADSGQQAAGVELRAIASLGASSHVLWKNVHISSQRLYRFRFRAPARALSDVHWETISNSEALQQLMLDGANVTDDDLVKLRHNPKLQLLYLKNTAITSRGVQHLKQLAQLETLHLTRTNVDDRAAVTLGGLANLRTLGLSDTGVGDAAIAELRRLPRLEVLGLRNTALTDDSVDHFSTMTSLRNLDLRGATLSAAGVARIRKALPGCSVNY